ncbi:MAG: hypothetical protein ACI4DR_02290 [Roseburia sp.]
MMKGRLFTSDLKDILAKSQENRMLPVLLTLLMIPFLCGCFLSRQESEQEKELGVIAAIEGLQGYTRVVGQEEYELYAYLVERALGKEVSEEEKEEQIKEYANKVNATFYLGDRLGLHEPFSFEVLKMRLEQENETRRIKLENNEVIYGLKEFELHTYLQYEMANLELDIVSYLMTNLTDEEIGKKAEEYYNANEQNFRYMKNITYDVTMNGETETIVLERVGLRALGNQDPFLGDFLSTGSVGDIYEDLGTGVTGEMRTVVIRDIEYAPMGYEKNKEEAKYGYVQSELYAELLKLVMVNNPVEFKLD